ncbi:hypothetical protein Patl1_22448 [Pistacia atlantica]|uniref:Uncharacterized protein n=1 Tax=Pistacia atlantica TaxID=434234 RepID=A0ACC0ZUP2_9ROSI|nr:hypothetical protein Patl1_22448 [Pistacia atlantica]
MAPKPKPTTRDSSSSIFKPGTLVEVSSNDVGFRGSWFTGTVIRRASKKDPFKYLIQYIHLFSDESGTKPLREIIDLGQLRPVAPREKKREFKFSEEVDAFYNDGWWEGAITEVNGDKFKVYFRSSKEQFEFTKEDLRLHREWLGGDKWKPPLKEEEEEEENGLDVIFIAVGNGHWIMALEGAKTFSIFLNFELQKVSTESKTEDEHDKAVTEVKFDKGALVEVSSDEDGFDGAWFAATVIEPVGKDKYLIEYQSLRTEDDTEFLREEVDILHIRPSPPDTVVVDSFNRLDEVDALYNDGWWVGVISKVLTNSKYIVYFKNTLEEMQFGHSELRLHQEWIDGKWIVTCRGFEV